MTETSVLQQKAADLRQLKSSIAEYEKILPIVQKDVTDARVSLMQAESNLRDTVTLLTAQKVKLTNDIADMSDLLDMALTDINL
jgi:hypothetical protein